MKSHKLLAILTLVSLFAGAALFAADEKKDAVESKPAKCCAKAAAAGEKCTHECCVEAAKAGNNCEKCKGSGKIEKHEEKTK
jgi:hypothetical protein